MKYYMKFVQYMVITVLSILGLMMNAYAAPSDSKVEEQARIIERSLRCVVCQNQSISESDAPLAKDMRMIVRKRIRMGDSPDDVIKYMRDRYGDYVLLKPPVQKNTYILWFGPFILLGAFLLWFLSVSRKSLTEPQDTAPLTPDEISRLEDLKNEISS